MEQNMSATAQPTDPTGNSTTPKVITAVRVITVIQMVLAVAFIAVAVWLVSYQPVSGFWAGFREAMTAEMPLYSYEDAGALAAGPIIVIIAGVLVLMALVKRTRKWAITAYVALGIQIAIGISSLSIPFLAIANVLLLASAQGKAYLGMEKKVAAAPATDSQQ